MLRRPKKTKLERLADSLARTEAISRSVAAGAATARTAVSSMGSGANRARKPLAVALVPAAIGAGAFVLIRRKRSKRADSGDESGAASADAQPAPGQPD